MNYKQIVINRIKYIETDIVPYTLGFQEESRNRLNVYYGSGEWRKRIKPHIKPVWIMDCQCKKAVDDMRTRDIYGSIWFEDDLMSHLEKPILSEPSLSNYIFPSVDISANQKFYEELTENITNHIMKFVDIAIKLHVEGIMFGDDWGGQTGLFRGKKGWQKYFKDKYRMLYEKVHQSGKFVLNHCCGNIVEILLDLIDIGLDVYESFQPETMEIYSVKRKFGDDITFWGGLGAQSTIPFGSPEEIHKTVEDLRSKMAYGGGFILAPSKDPPPETPIENLIALIDAFAGQGV